MKATPQALRDSAIAWKQMDDLIAKGYSYRMLFEFLRYKNEYSLSHAHARRAILASDKRKRVHDLANGALNRLGLTPPEPAPKASTIGGYYARSVDGVKIERGITIPDGRRLVVDNDLVAAAKEGTTVTTAPVIAATTATIVTNTTAHWVDVHVAACLLRDSLLAVTRHIPGWMLSTEVRRWISDAESLVEKTKTLT